MLGSIESSTSIFIADKCTPRLVLLLMALSDRDVTIILLPYPCSDIFCNIACKLFDAFCNFAASDLGRESSLPFFNGDVASSKERSISLSQSDFLFPARSGYPLSDPQWRDAPSLFRRSYTRRNLYNNIFSIISISDTQLAPSSPLVNTSDLLTFNPLF